MNGTPSDWLVTLAVFMPAGWALARRRRRPATLTTIILLIVALVLGLGIGLTTRLLSVMGVDLYLNLAIAAACLGAFFGLAVPRRAERAPSP